MPAREWCRSERGLRSRSGFARTALLLLAEKELIRSSGQKVKFYRVMPLFSEERDLQIKKGIAVLMRAFDQGDISLVVDPKRANVGFLGMK